MNVAKSLLFACAFSLLLSTTASADEAKEKKMQGIHKAIDKCIEFLEKREFEAFVEKGTHPWMVEDINKTKEYRTKYIAGIKRDADEILTAMKAAKKIDPIIRKAEDPKEERAIFVFEKSIFKDRELMIMHFQTLDGIWYFMD